MMMMMMVKHLPSAGLAITVAHHASSAAKTQGISTPQPML
jgi:hypothetical protein